MRFGSLKAAVAALGKSVEAAKRLADSKRHIERKGQTLPPPGDPIALATQAYERHLSDAPCSEGLSDWAEPPVLPDITLSPVGDGGGLCWAPRWTAPARRLEAPV
jgi:hypothetical protein